jgi:hypothetical protein
MFKKINGFLNAHFMKASIYLLVSVCLMYGSYASYNYVTDPVEYAIPAGVQAAYFDVIGAIPDDSGHYLVAIVERADDDGNRKNNKAYSVTCIDKPQKTSVALPYDYIVNISHNGILSMQYVFRNDEVCNFLNKSDPLVKKGLFKI